MNKLAQAAALQLLTELTVTSLDVVPLVEPTFILLAEGPPQLSFSLDYTIRSVTMVCVNVLYSLSIN